jgi:hypothetical protein
VGVIEQEKKGFKEKEDKVFNFECIRVRALLLFDFESVFRSETKQS